MINKVAVNNFLLQGNEKKYINECIDTGWISGDGPFIEKFELNFSAYVSRRYGVAVANGSAALDIAIAALGISTGDEVIMPTLTIISPAFSVVRAGATPVLVDSDPVTFNMDVNQIESKITLKTKAIIIVHLYGLPAQVNEILAIAKKHNLKVIEDAAEMHGQTYHGSKCGSFGDISTFSFYANKIITTGEGGMLVCDDEDLAARCRKLRNLSFEPTQRRFVHYEMGYNYRITNMQAAIGLAQLEQADTLIKKKKAIGAYYNNALAFLQNYGYQLPLEKTEYAENIYWVYSLLVCTQKETEHIMAHLQTRSVGIRPFFWCMHEQPVFNKMNLFTNETYPVAEQLARNGFYIPSGLALTEADLAYVVKAFREIYG